MYDKKFQESVQQGGKCQLGYIIVFITVLLINNSASSAVGHQIHDLTGTAGQSVTLPCATHEGGQLRSVTWSDRVFSEAEEKPSVIFQSENNAAHHIKSTHPNSANYKVDSTFKLTIANLRASEDVGEYMCSYTGSSGTRHERRYFLSVASKPACSANATTVKAGGITKLSCEMEFGSNRQPTMEWYREQELIHSVDEFDAGFARRDVNLKATIDDDRVTYRCVTKLYDVVNTCEITLTVPHSVRKVQFAASKLSYHVGEELKCTAQGSPLPQITLRTSAVASKDSGVSDSERIEIPARAERTGDGWRSIVIPEEWVRKHVSVNCTAANTVDGKTSTVTTSISFNVTEASKAAAGKSDATQWNANLINTVSTSLWSLLMATWPIFIARFVC